MYAWGGGGNRRRPEGTADADNPSQETIERRRQADIEFLTWVREAPHPELEEELPRAKGWRRVAIERRLRGSFQFGLKRSTPMTTDSKNMTLADLDAFIDAILVAVPEAKDAGLRRMVWREQDNCPRYWVAHVRVQRRDKRFRKISGTTDLTGHGDTPEVAIEDLLRGVKYHATGSIA